MSERISCILVTSLCYFAQLVLLDLLLFLRRDFTLACDRLLNGPITCDALTKDELDILNMCVQRLTDRFISPRSPGQPPSQ